MHVVFVFSGRFGSLGVYMRSGPHISSPRFTPKRVLRVRESVLKTQLTRSSSPRRTAVAAPGAATSRMRCIVWLGP